MDSNIIADLAQAVQPVHVVLGIFIALILGALMQLRHMGTERRTNMLGKLLGKVVMFLGTLVIGGFILVSTLGGSLPIGDISSIVQQVQGAVQGGIGTLPLGTGGNPATTDYTEHLKAFDEINKKLSESGVFSSSR